MTGETKRFNLVRENSGLPKNDFAESLGISLAMVYQISTGRARVPRNLLERLATVHNVNLHWFITGSGHSISWAANSTRVFWFPNFLFVSFFRRFPLSHYPPPLFQI